MTPDLIEPVTTAGAMRQAVTVNAHKSIFAPPSSNAARPTMTKTKTCLDCFWHKLDQALRQDAEGYKSDNFDDDSSSFYDTENDDSELDDGSESEEDENEHGHVTNKSTVFQSIMHRLTSAETRADMECESAKAINEMNRYRQVADEHTRRPREHAEDILQSQGKKVKVRSYKSLKGFFIDHSPIQIAAYEGVSAAIRQNNLDELRRLHRAGHDLQCCNRFGESVVHTIARRGSPEIMRFLLDDAGCSIRVCCDSGRTAMHDAAWTSAPNFETIRLILERSPELLWIADNRNFTCLDYVPRDCWAQWCNFLDANKDLILTSHSHE
jgi:hypothetical protein